MKVTFFLVTSSMAMTVLAIDTPQGLLRNGKEARDLGILCNGQLSACKSTVSGGIPSQEWTASLDNVPEASASVAGDVKAFIAASLNADFSAEVAAIKGLSAKTRIKVLAPALRDLSQRLVNLSLASATSIAITIPSINDILQGVIGLLSGVIGVARGLLATVLGSVAGLLQGLLTVAVDIPAALVQNVVVPVGSFVGGLLQQLLNLSINIGVNSKCEANLMECNYTAMLLNFIPAFIQVLLNVN